MLVTLSESKMYFLDYSEEVVFIFFGAGPCKETKKPTLFTFARIAGNAIYIE